MVKGDKRVIVGDHKQLLPIFKSVKDPNAQEGLSAFVNLLKKYEHKHLWLKIHYGGNKEIIGFPAERVYGGKIKPAEACESYRLSLTFKPMFLVELRVENNRLWFKTSETPVEVM